MFSLNELIKSPMKLSKDSSILFDILLFGDVVEAESGVCNNFDNYLVVCVHLNIVKLYHRSHLFLCHILNNISDNDFC